MVDLPLVWAALMAFAVLLYTLLDGFDLGIGILFPFAPTAQERGVMMKTIAATWDGNETWLVFAGGGLMAVFPLAYAVIMSGLYVPIITMLLALAFRGVAFEFRWQMRQTQKFWDWSFALGSLTAAFCQGLTLGALIEGIPVSGRAYAGGAMDFLTPFSLLTGVALVIGYALLGATWLIKKTHGRIQDDAYRFAAFLGPALALLIVIVSIWTPFIQPVYRDHWFAWPNILYSAFVPIALMVTLYVFFHGLANHRDHSPFWAAEALFVICFIGLGISFYPYIVPGAYTIWQAAAPESSLKFLLVGASVLVPIILCYTAASYWTFRGKTDPSDAHAD